MTFPTRILAPATAVLALSLAPTQAEAADRFVPIEFDTIQEAIEASNLLGGDRIIISRKKDGAYNEYVEIDRPVQIIGKNIVIDVLGKTPAELNDFNGVVDPGIEADAPALAVYSDDVSISGVTVINSLGDGIYAEGNGITISRSEVYHCAGNGIQVLGDDAEISRNESWSNGGFGIVYGGATATGGDGTIERNISYLNGDSGFLLQGGNLRVSRNRSSNNQNDGMLVASAGFGDGTGDNEISKNSLTCNGRSGICIADPGDNPVEIEGNACDQNGAHGVAMEFGTDVDISKNRLRNNTGNGVWIFGAVGVVVQSNRVQGNGRNGISIENVFGGDPGGGSDQGNHFVRFNTVQSNGRDGIRLRGSNNTIESNTLTRNLGDGIDLVSGGISPTDNNALTGNRMTRNGGEGIDNDGSNTSMVGNRSSKNGDGGLGPEIAGLGHGNGSLGTFQNNKTSDDTEDEEVAEVTEQVVDID